jgi:hypothetical protein
MASGHVNRANKAEHMAAPHRYLRREDFPCQFGAVHTWPISEHSVALLNSRLPPRKEVLVRGDRAAHNASAFKAKA